MPSNWEIDETMECVNPPPDSVVADEPVGELTDEDIEAASAGVTLPADAEGEAA